MASGGICFNSLMEDMSGEVRRSMGSAWSKVHM